MLYRNCSTTMILTTVFLILNGCGTDKPNITKIDGVSKVNNEIRINLPNGLPFENIKVGDNILELRRGNDKPIKLKGITKREGTSVVFQAVDNINDNAINGITQLYLYDAGSTCTLPSGFLRMPVILRYA